MVKEAARKVEMPGELFANFVTIFDPDLHYMQKPRHFDELNRRCINDRFYNTGLNHSDFHPRVFGIQYD